MIKLSTYFDIFFISSVNTINWKLSFLLFINVVVVIATEFL